MTPAHVPRFYDPDASGGRAVVLTEADRAARLLIRQYTPLIKLVPGSKARVSGGKPTPERPDPPKWIVHFSDVEGQLGALHRDATAVYDVDVRDPLAALIPDAVGLGSVSSLRVRTPSGGTHLYVATGIRVPPLRSRRELLKLSHDLITDNATHTPLPGCITDKGRYEIIELPEKLHRLTRDEHYRTLILGLLQDLRKLAELPWDVDLWEHALSFVQAVPDPYQVWYELRDEVGSERLLAGRRNRPPRQDPRQAAANAWARLWRGKYRTQYAKAKTLHAASSDAKRAWLRDRDRRRDEWRSTDVVGRRSEAAFSLAMSLAREGKGEDDIVADIMNSPLRSMCEDRRRSQAGQRAWLIQWVVKPAIHKAKMRNSHWAPPRDMTGRGQVNKRTARDFYGDRQTALQVKFVIANADQFPEMDRLSAKAVDLLSRFGELADKYGKVCYAALRSLAEWVGVSPATVSVLLKELQKQYLVVAVPRHQPDYVTSNGLYTYDRDNDFVPSDQVPEEDRYHFDGNQATFYRILPEPTSSVISNPPTGSSQSLCSVQVGGLIQWSTDRWFFAERERELAEFSKDVTFTSDEEWEVLHTRVQGSPTDRGRAWVDWGREPVPVEDRATFLQRVPVELAAAMVPASICNEACMLAHEETELWCVCQCGGRNHGTVRLR